MTINIATEMLTSSAKAIAERKASASQPCKIEVAPSS